MHYIEDSKKKAGLAFDVVLQPSTKTVARPPKIESKDKTVISQELIDKKLKEAEKRRLVSDLFS